MKRILKELRNRIIRQHPRELKGIIIALMCSLLFTLLFQLYYEQKMSKFLTATSRHVTENMSGQLDAQK